MNLTAMRPSRSITTTSSVIPRRALLPRATVYAHLHHRRHPASHLRLPLAPRFSSSLKIRSISSDESGANVNVNVNVDMAEGGEFADTLTDGFGLLRAPVGGFENSPTSTLGDPRWRAVAEAAGTRRRERDRAVYRTGTRSTTTSSGSDRDDDPDPVLETTGSAPPPDSPSGISLPLLPPDWGVATPSLDDLLSFFAFDLDTFQKSAVTGLLEGDSVVVCAPTGAGKTAIAEAGALACLSQGKRVIYTTPLKALSNQKLGELREKFGDVAVGLQTGDVSLNAEAEVTVMTTEILRNIIYRAQVEERRGVAGFEEPPTPVPPKTDNGPVDTNSTSTATPGGGDGGGFTRGGTTGAGGDDRGRCASGRRGSDRPRRSALPIGPVSGHRLGGSDHQLPVAHPASEYVGDGAEPG